ncbi:protein O-linked-mannose beta-1,2-N-acetylglucosaminyltransferase 1-like [Pollicipes pollicipes]|uniref:protein O-linked-mannose beta-1,2-N-acetylglucosaminyltransferase 1-like n=1 Tax=Pollicipes pollicipes TaxID=41117 RepID=UPI00188502C7|nr:protein O-linked-mannose beta-1,2-N-acetylglucosaminyltransferase 1-like [Pollicipes pollicipes]
MTGSRYPGGWQPNPRAAPYVPRRLAAAPTPLLPPLLPLGRRCSLSRLCQRGLVAVIIVTIVINVLFILDTSRKLRARSKGFGDTDGLVRSGRGNSLRLQQSAAKSLTIEAYSSQARAAVMADGATILEHNNERHGPRRARDGAGTRRAAP